MGGRSASTSEIGLFRKTKQSFARIAHSMAHIPTRPMCLVFYLMLACCSNDLSEEEKRPKMAEWREFEKGRQIFIDAELTGPNGAKVYATLNLDTGLNRTTLSPDLVAKLSLVPNGITHAHASSGVVDQQTVLLPLLRVGAISKEQLTVAIQDMKRLKETHKRNVDGLLGSDCFGQGVLSIDFSHSRLSFDPTAEIAGEKIADLPINLFKGVPLVDLTLPSNLVIPVIVDTGAEDPVPFVFYREGLEGTKLKHFSEITGGDAASARITMEMASIDGAILLGTYKVDRPMIVVHESVADNPYNTKYRPGIMTYVFLEDFAIQLDYTHQRLILFKPSAH